MNINENKEAILKEIELKYDSINQKTDNFFVIIYIENFEGFMHHLCRV